MGVCVSEREGGDTERTWVGELVYYVCLCVYESILSYTFMYTYGFNAMCII